MSGMCVVNAKRFLIPAILPFREGHFASREAAFAWGIRSKQWVDNFK